MTNTIVNGMHHILYDIGHKRDAIMWMGPDGTLTESYDLIHFL